MSEIERGDCASRPRTTSHHHLWWRCAIYLSIPTFLIIALGSFAITTPPFGEPDSKYHLASIYCGQGTEKGMCEAGNSPHTRYLRADATGSVCFAFKPYRGSVCLFENNDAFYSYDEASADSAGTPRAQTDSTASSGKSAAAQPPNSSSYSASASKLLPPYTRNGLIETDIGNFQGSYPQVYYAVQHFFVGNETSETFRNIRFVNIIAVSLALATLIALLPARRRPIVWISVAITMIPLAAFTVASINPSAWAFYSPLIIFAAIASMFQQHGWRKWALIFFAAITLLVTAGTRTDAGMYCMVAVLIGVLAGIRFTRQALRFYAVGIAIFALICIAALQHPTIAAYVDLSNVFNLFSTAISKDSSSHGLLHDNAINLVTLWTGIFGTTNLSWMDLPVPITIPILTGFVTITVLWYGIRQIRWTQLLGILVIIVNIAIWPLSIASSRNIPIEYFVQSRYLAPMIILAVVLIGWNARPAFLTRNHAIVCVGALTMAFLITLIAIYQRFYHDPITGQTWWPEWAPPFTVVATISTTSFALFCTCVFFILPRIEPATTADENAIHAARTAHSSPHAPHSHNTWPLQKGVAAEQLTTRKQAINRRSIHETFDSENNDKMPTSFR
ncbi:DUF2142 domain-containing protein [Trueperella sp. LYQ143]|uniref:DUF2142 domain-containing protein n=1 Tax=Trueperella sp. LYQ143 TaxID=3391059 RepID=UPI003983B4EA